MEKNLKRFAKPGNLADLCMHSCEETLDHLIGDSKCPSVKSETSTMKRITLLSDDKIMTSAPWPPPPTPHSLPLSLHRTYAGVFCAHTGMYQQWPPRLVCHL